MIKKSKSKKLKIKNINKNNNKNVENTINKIRENERKHMTILVISFMLLFCLISYLTFRVDSNEDKFPINTSDLNLSGDVFALTENDIKSDQDGINEEGKELFISNNSEETLNYKIKLVQDEYSITKDNCKSRQMPFEYIKYSINNENISTISPNNNGEIIVTTGTLKSNETKSINIKIWFSLNSPRDQDYHLHGYFTIDRLDI